MGYSNKLRTLFPDITLQAEDLLLLEAFQVRYLPDRVPPNEFSTLLRTHPVLHNFLVAKWPGISAFIDRILKENKSLDNQKQVDEYCQEALWEIADLIVYNKYPERFDTNAPNRWELSELSSITPLEGKVLADVGAGSGRVAFMVAPLAETVFAVEPVTSLRSFMKEKASKANAKNVFVIDGTLDSIPLPDNSLDVLLTSNAIGWDLPKELKEIERVVKPGGHAIHLLWSNEAQENPFHVTLTSAPWSYSCLQNKSQNEIKIRYTRQVAI